MARTRWLGQRIVALADAFEREPLGQASGVRASQALVALVALAFVFPLSAVPRYFFGWSLNVSLGVAFAVFVVFVVVFWPLLGARRGSGCTLGAASLLTALLSGAALVLLRASPFDAFPALGGGDAGNHLNFQHRFESNEPRVYTGMTALYALHHWLVQLASTDDLGAYASSWQLVVIACSALASFAVVAHAQGTSRRRQVVVALVSVLSVLAVGFFVVLPRIHYYQVDGFLGHLFSLVPLALGALAYAATSRRFLRLVVLVATLGACRFSYVLNAGDLFVMCAVLAVAELFEAPARRAVRVCLCVVALTCLVGAVLAYINIAEIVRTPGGFLPAPMTLQLVGLGLLTLVWCSAGAVCRRWGAACPPEHLRLSCFFAPLVGMPFLLVTAWLATGNPLSYYVHKYVFCAIVLGALCVPPVVVSAATALVAQGPKAKTALAASALLALAASALLALGASAQPYLAGYYDRISGPPYEHLGPHGDRAVWGMIEATLRREQAEFGGLMTPRWPESQFTNAHFRSQRIVDDYEGKVQRQPGHCVFWYEDLPEVLQQTWTAGPRQTIAELRVSRRHQCESFTPKYAPGERLSLCSRCFVGITRQISLTTQSAGFDKLERKGGKEARWTNGDGRVPLILTEAEAALACMVRVDTLGDRPYELWLDGKILGPGPRRPLPRLAAGSQHELAIRSATFAKGKRVRGVLVQAITLDCRDELFLSGSRRVPLATATDGFYGLETTPDGRELRWTNGQGRIPLSITAAEAGLPCEVRVETVRADPYELWLDGKLLGPGPHQPLPAFAKASQHELEIRSPTFVPAKNGGSDERVLGVLVETVAVDCRDEFMTRLVPLETLSAGFHGLEHTADGADARWTNGEGRVPLTITAQEAELFCRVRVETVGDQPYELWWDGQLLGPGPHQAIGKFDADSRHELWIRSASSSPDPRRSPDERVLGVLVGTIALDCGSIPLESRPARP